ncbi:uncharacterized protein LOC143008971 [Genypterus blacodes]|uniref:uncharacterized protein LOC143008971 n=1 Tax=Genypterus blacodes TaxID=154954 RepID=UPI003F75C22C
MKPVELLIKSLNDLATERNDAPFAAVRVMHESYEKERGKLLQKCREERKRIIKSDRWSGGRAALGLETGSSDSKVKQNQESIQYVDLSKETSVSRLSCPAAIKDVDRGTICNCSLGDLRHSPANEMKLKRLTEDIKKKMNVTVSERDRKIAALMLVKHQEELSRLKMSHQEERERREARKKQETQQAREEQNRRKKLKKSMQRWNEELEVRRRLRLCLEELQAGVREREVLLQEDRWRRVRKEMEERHREKMKAAHKEAEVRKQSQEKLLRDKEELEKRELEMERRVALEREEKARRSRESLEKKERKKVQEDNHRQQLWHVLLKQQVEEQVEEQQVHMRGELDKKLQQSMERRAQAEEERLRELQERATREEKQIQRAQLRAKLQSVQQLTYKQLLVQESQRRMERAVKHVSAQQWDRAQQARRTNKDRQHSHQRLKDRVQREEEAARKARERHVTMKECRRERLRQQREETQEEAHRVARASFHMRELVRQQTHTRTFDEMALEAQLSASISNMKV